MAYSITCYHSDEYIANTKIYISTIGMTYNLAQAPKDDNGDDAMWTSAGFAYSATFTATPTTDGEFYQWVFRIGSMSSEKRTLLPGENLPSEFSRCTLKSDGTCELVYTGGQDIYIRAEGKSAGSGGGDDGGDTGSWTLYRRSIGNLSSTYTRFFDVGTFARQSIYAFYMTFANSGIATFYTDGSVDTVGFLSDSDECIVNKSNYGRPEPANILASGDQEIGQNFKITYRVVAEKPYYLFIRDFSGSDLGSTTLVIEPPEKTEVDVIPWTWEVGTGSDRDKAYQALVNKTSTRNFKYGVWNAMVDKVLEIIEADPDESTWFTSGDGKPYLSSSDTKMTNTEEGRKMTAARFNALRYNIGSRGNAPSTGIDDKIPGDVVYGKYFLKLAECINGWINNL